MLTAFLYFDFSFMVWTLLGPLGAQIGEALFGRLRAVAPRWTVNPYAKHIPIVPAQFGTESGVIGAAAVIMGTSQVDKLG